MARNIRNINFSQSAIAASHLGFKSNISTTKATVATFPPQGFHRHVHKATLPPQKETTEVFPVKLLAQQARYKGTFKGRHKGQAASFGSYGPPLEEGSEKTAFESDVGKIQ